MLKLALSCALFGLVTCGFFDFSEVDDPFAMLWNSHVGQKFRECSVDENTKGTCMDKSACLNSGGKPTYSKCPFFKTCCSHKNYCMGESNAKQGNFESGEVATNLTDCRYTINLRNRNVCQVRLDFEELILAPTVKVESNDMQQFSCTNDFLKISPGYYGIPILCGLNTKQHVYVHFNVTEHPEQAVTIDIHLKNRDDNPKLVVPSWKIKFTQLECPLKRPKFDPATYGEIKHINNDFNLLAPHGAIQYFPDSSGKISSFGYTGTDNYVMPQYYAIAFRRSASTCGIKFSKVNIDLGCGKIDGKCVHYLYVPEATTAAASTGSSSLTGTEDVYGDHFCTEKSLDIHTPQGAIQFFGDTTGLVESFGYNAFDDSQYSTWLHYSIAFRRTAHACAIKFFNANISILHPHPAGDPCQDYLLIPEQWPDLDDDHNCGINSSSLFFSRAPGPFFIIFKSTASTRRPLTYLGFSMNYELVADCSPYT